MPHLQHPPSTRRTHGRNRLCAGLALSCVSATAPCATELTEIFGLTLYSYGWVLGFAQVIAVVTFFVGVVRYRDRAPRAMLKATAKLVAIVVAVWLFVINADLFWNSYRASALCRSEGGLHRYGHAEVEGFVGRDFNYYHARGFSYIEGYRTKGLEQQKVRWTMRGEEVVSEPIEEFQSRHEFDGEMVTINKRIQRSRFYVRDRVNGAILSEYVRFHVSPSWYETFLSALLPGEGSRWHCGHQIPEGYIPLNPKRPSQTDAVIIALHPKPRTEAQP